MRLTILALLAATASVAAEIPKGTHVLLRMVNSVSTRTAREGDYVYLRTATPIVAGGVVLVPVDSYVQGIVIHSKRSGRVKGVAELGIRIQTLTMSGKVIQMTPSLTSIDSEGTDQKVIGKESTVQQGTSHGADAVKIAGTSAAGAALGGLTDRGWRGAGIGAGIGSGVGLATVLLTRGREVELKQGSTMDVTFDRPVAID
jgi:type IV secretion system protein VirB10